MEASKEASPESVLDASALLAFLQGESGDETVEAALAAGCLLKVVNYAEALLRLADAGEEPAVGVTVHLIRQQRPASYRTQRTLSQLPGAAGILFAGRCKRCHPYDRDDAADL